jgi:hypothetical protein
VLDQMVNHRGASFTGLPAVLYQMAPQTSEYALGEAVRIEGALRVTKLLPMAAKLPCRVLHGSHRK